MAGRSEGGGGAADNNANSCVGRRMALLSPEPVKSDTAFSQLCVDQFFSSSGGDMISQVVELVANELTTSDNNNNNNNNNNNSSVVMDFQGGGDGLHDDDHVNIEMPPEVSNNVHVVLPPGQLIRALLTISLLTLVFDVSTALYRPATGVLFGRSKVAYYVTLAAIFVSGVAEAFVALWISRSADANRRSFAFGRVLVCASTVPLVAILGISGSGFIKG